ncbi:hypothetical protein K2X05_14140 [bacterium]|nr:hypothetical protein [bacterium]
MMMRFLKVCILLGLAVSSVAQGQSKSKKPQPAAQNTSTDVLSSSRVGSDGPTLNFDTGDAPAQKDDRGTLKFSDGSLNPPSKKGTPEPIVTNDTAPDEQGFKSYLGYPMHEVTLLNGVDSISATFSYRTQDFNFSTTTFTYGLSYKYIATPAIKIGAYFMQYNIGVNSGTASGLNILESDETLAQFGITTEYCSIQSSNFYNQFCIGGVIAKDAYPMLNFVSSSRLTMASLEDIVLGLNVAYQMALTDKLLFKPMLGYNHGTASGDSGVMTPKSNSRLYIRAELPWMWSEKTIIRFHGDYSLRKAEAEGTIGSNFDPWKTDSANLGVGADLSLRW